MRKSSLAIRIIGLIVLLALLDRHPAQSQTTRTLRIQAQRITAPLKLDGYLDEAFWKICPLLDSFMQASPNQGGKPSEKTEVRIAYDNENLYVGIKAYDSSGRYMVSGLQRDQYSRSEDGVSVMLDTYNDKIHALQFYTNTAGLRYDAEISDNGSGLNPAYNTFWYVKTRIQADGYTAEFQIPFSSLRFQHKETVVMGFKIHRQIARKNEYDIFPPCDKNLGNIVRRVSTEGELEFSNLKARIPIYLTPYLKTNFTQNYRFIPSSQSYEASYDWQQRNHFSANETSDKILSSMGLDAKIGLSKNFTLDASINTDFAQAEVDNRIFNYTRYNIFLPEKRQFFLEANDYLNFEMPGQIQLFNSRNIGIKNGQIIPIIGGVRITGKAQGWQLGALNMQTQGFNRDGISSENFTVAHLHKDLFRNGSYCSGFFSNRISTNDKSMDNQTYGADLLLRQNEKWTWAFNFAATKDADRSKFFDKNIVYNMAVFRTVTFGYSNFLTYTKVGSNFRPMSGFYADNGYSMFYAINSYTFKINKPKFNYFDLSTESYIKWDTRNTGGIETHTQSLVPSLGLKNGMDVKTEIKLYAFDLLPFDWEFSEHILIPANRYSIAGTTFTIGSPLTKKWLYKCTMTGDKFYGGHRIALQPEMSNVFNKHFTIGASYLYTYIRFPHSFSVDDRPIFNSHLFILKMLYALNYKTSFNTLIQYDTDSKTMGINFRFRYNPREGTDLYIVYNPTLQPNANRYLPVKPYIPQQLFIAKFAKTLGR